ncbi:hypothetical protein BH09PSE4_BH09PSE4_15840 [soil metagenome]
MKKLSIAVAALGFAAAALPSAASAQAWQGHNNNAPAWQNINQRQANLYQRIDMGVRSGTLDRREAARLKSEYGRLVSLEARYRRGGLNMWERNDLNRRFDPLSMRIRSERNDRDMRGPDHGPGRDGPPRRY